MLNKKLIIALIPALMAGCSQPVKSPNEPLLQAESQESRQQDLMKPKAADFSRAARLYVELGVAYLKEGQIGRAKLKLLRAQKLAPDLPEVHFALGFYKETVGEIGQAEKHYLTAVSKQPKSGLARNNYGTFLCRQGKYREAEKEFLVAIADPDYTQTAEAFENAGLCVAQIPDMAKAEMYFERAVKMDPKRTEALLELGMIRLKEKNYSSALEHYTLYKEQAVQNPRSLWLGVKLAEYFKDTNQLASLKMLLKQKFPQSAEFHELSKSTS